MNVLKVRTVCTSLLIASIFTTTCNCNEDGKLPPPQPNVGGNAGSSGSGGQGGSTGDVGAGAQGGGGKILVDGKVPTCLEEQD